MDYAPTTVLVVVSVAAVLSVVGPARCQVDRPDDKYLDPNDYFLAGGDQQERRRVQDAFDRRVRRGRAHRAFFSFLYNTPVVIKCLRQYYYLGQI